MEKIDLNGKTIFVTGGAGFIGSNLIQRLFHDFSGVKIDTNNCSYISVIHYCASSPIRSLY